VGSGEEMKLKAIENEIIPANWNLVNVGDFVEIKHGYAFKGKYFIDEENDNLVLTPGNFHVGGGFKGTKFKYTTENYPEDYILKKDDIIVSMTDLSKKGDTLGYASKIPESNNKNFLHNQRLGLLKFNSLPINHDFLYWVLRNKNYNLFVVGSATGSTVKHTSPSRIKQYAFACPSDLREQKKIANLLSSLDDKITLNNHMNQTLEAMAQAIFKSWFVDFEPVKAKIAAIEAGEDAESVNRAVMRAISGRSDEGLDKMQAEQPDEYAQLKGTAELFPAAMWDSELGEVPEGWGSSSVGAEFDAIMGQSPPGDTYNENGEGEPFFQGRRDFGWRYPDNRVYCTQPKRMAKKGDTLLSVRAPVGDINKATSNCCIGRGIAALRHKSGCEAYTYYSMMDLSRNFKSFDSEGTVFGSINQKDLKALNVLKPSSSIVEAFTYAVGIMDQEILNLDKQVRVLSQLRNILLPNLLSGEVCLAGLKVRDTV
jgi:type I restriction enzyme S subunit